MSRIRLFAVPGGQEATGDWLSLASHCSTMPDLRTRRRQWRFGVIAAATGGRQAPLSTGLFQFRSKHKFYWRGIFFRRAVDA